MDATTGDDLAALISGVAAKVETARAKVNLALHILGRRADGYHLIDSLVVFADMGDTLRATPRDEGPVKLTIDGPFGDELDRSTRPEDNLVIRAADELLAAFPRRRIGGVQLGLTKRLPVASGLGGGSADAAAALRLLDRLWNLGAGGPRLAEIGARLGADVPMCLVSRPLQAGGIGEQITLAPAIPALPLLLVNPGVAVPTRNVFRRLAPGERPPMWPLPARFASRIEFAQWLRMTRNDLCEPAIAEARVVGAVVKAVSSDAECLFANLSGSGATVFGIFNSRAAAERAAARIHQKKPDWWVAVTQSGGA
ncbi:MAG: 4-(cytidine 5'-diphospho)-2-C-methyl-D-erythritol kinase [Rhizobiales bacterium]|nr:4-(cytidine 5'-diphospho)-2-C-methyl-D-erythritol kinase [Hyphomicrobiales bacterium]